MAKADLLTFHFFEAVCFALGCPKTSSNIKAVDAALELIRVALVLAMLHNLPNALARFGPDPGRAGSAQR